MGISRLKGRRMARAAGLAGAALALSGTIGTGDARAGGQFDYCGKVIQSGSYCRGGNGVNTSTAGKMAYVWNAAYYTGSVGINICEKVIPGYINDNPYDPNAWSYNCGTAYGGINGARQTSGYDLEPNCWAPFDDMWVYVRNNSGSQHTVYGRAKYGADMGYPCP